MAAVTVNEVVKTLIELGTDYEVRLAQPDREDGPETVTFRVNSGERDRLLAGGVSGLEFWEYLVTVRGRDGADAETEARSIQSAIDSLAVNYAVDNFIIQSASTGSVSDEDRGDLVGDTFQYQYSFTVSLAIGRAS